MSHSEEQRNHQPPRVTRREFHGLLAAVGISVLTPLANAGQTPWAFAHPGILHSAADLKRMRGGVQSNLSPISDGFAKLREHPLSRTDFANHEFDREIGRNPSVNFPRFDDDCAAAYQCAVLSAITGEAGYARTAQNIVLGWSRSLQSVSGADAVLMAGLGPFKLINAAELLRAGGKLDAGEVLECQKMLKRAILPAIIDFAPFANGNWDTAAIKTMLAIAVFCDDRELFDHALLYYLHGDGNGRLEHYIYANGQCQESGRDQQHTQLGLAHMADACEIAWHQGLDLYGAMNNRLLAGFEYTASYNLGDEVDFHPDIDRTGKYRHRIVSPRGALRPVYEQVLAHYHVRRGLPTPALERAVAQLRPEGAGPGADHTGFGTLLYARTDSSESQDTNFAAPAALYAEASGSRVDLAWLPLKSASSYLVERAERGGAFHLIQAGISGTEFRDTSVVAAKKYSYRISTKGSAPSLVERIFSGLPHDWMDAPLGCSPLPSSAQSDGNVLTIRATGSGLMSSADEGHLVYARPECATLEARFLPQIASQFAIFGAMYRESLLPIAPSVALLVSPLAGDIERHDWQIRLLVRDAGGSVHTIASHSLEQPVVQFGRLVEPLWFRLERKDSHIRAEYSANGIEWNLCGEVPIKHDGSLGLAASSGFAEIETSVRFDSITLSVHRATNGR